MKTTLFVTGFDNRTRARNLAYEFERYGRLVRCDIPAPRSYAAKPYAFVQFENNRDAEDALSEMHGRNIDGYNLHIQWARVPLRTDDNRRKFNHSINNNMSRSRSPYRRERSTSPSNRGRSSPVYNNSSPSQSRLRSRSPRSPFHRRNSFSRSPVDN